MQRCKYYEHKIPLVIELEQFNNPKIKQKNFFLITFIHYSWHQCFSHYCVRDHCRIWGHSTIDNIDRTTVSLQKKTPTRQITAPRPRRISNNNRQKYNQTNQALQFFSVHASTQLDLHTKISFRYHDLSS
jgi:hypothetical protein